MRKIIAISLLFAFTALQYGKTVSWLYCELRVEIADNGKPSCDCEQILTDKKADDTSTPISHSHSHKEKLSEPFTSDLQKDIFNSIQLNTSCFSNLSTDLQSGFTHPPYHPPAFIIEI